jgi:hypothetical protein
MKCDGSHFADMKLRTSSQLGNPKCEESCNIFVVNMILLRIPASSTRFHLTLATFELGFLPMCICVVHEDAAKHNLPNNYS